MGALQIVNDVLLAGMKVVGDLFGSGEMQLPFVLQSAETMKASVAHLEPHMEKVEGDVGKGKIVLATVKGDVHDIGKNLVDIILTNNGYEVHNLGIKVSISDLIAKAVEVKADAIGMSGLLVKSTLVMRDNLEELNTRELSTIPVILGGAALTRSYVERDLREVYQGRLLYGKDAFEGLHVMDRLGELRRGETVDDDWGVVPSDSKVPSRLHTRVEVDESTLPDRSPAVETDNPIFKPPFLGPRMLKGVAIDEIATFVNETSLFRNQWQYRPEGSSKRGKAALEAGDEITAPTESDADFKDRIRPILREQLDIVRREGLLAPAALYGWFPCNGDGRDLVIWTDESRTTEQTRFNFPRQTKDPFLCMADFVRPDRLARRRLRGVPDRDDGVQGVRAHRRAVRREQVPGVPPPARLERRDGRGAWPSTCTSGSAPSGASSTRTDRRSPACSASSTAAAATRGATRRVPTSRTTNGAPSCSAPRRWASSATRTPATSSTPSSRPAAIVFHHPRAKYFVAR